MKRRVYAAVLGSFAALLLVAVPASAQLQQIAIRGDASPEPGSDYHKFEPRPAAGGDLAGNATAFRARLKGPLGNLRGIFSEDPIAAGATVALRGGAAPGGQGFRRFLRPSINASGVTAWHASLGGSGRGVFRDGPQNVALVGDTVPGGGVLDDLARAVITNVGDVVFQSTVSGGPLVGGVEVDAGIFRCTGGDGDCSTGTGTLEALVLVTDAVPDRAGREFCEINEGVGASDYGIAFQAATKMDCSDGGESALEGAFRLAFGGAVETLGLEGESSEPSPLPGGTIYDSFDDAPVIEATGIVAFKARTAGVTSERVICRCDPGSCPASPAAAIVQDGQADPAGSLVSKFSALGISDAGDVSFHCGVTPIVGRRGKGVYLWRAAGGVLERVAGRDDPVPGLPGTTFAKVEKPGEMSGGGRVAFRAKAKVAGAPNIRGVFLFE